MNNTKTYFLIIFLAVPTMSRTMDLIADVIYDYNEKVQLLFPAEPTRSEWTRNAQDLTRHMVCQQGNLGCVTIEETVGPVGGRSIGSGSRTFWPSIATVWYALLPFGSHTLRAHLEADLEDAQTKFTNVHEEEIKKALLERWKSGLMKLGPACSFPAEDRSYSLAETDPIVFERSDGSWKPMNELRSEEELDRQ